MRLAERLRAMAIPGKSSVALLLLVLAARCEAAEFLVTQAQDSGRGSLRQALLDANRTPGPDRIRFDSVDGPFALPQTISLRSELPQITDEIEIDGFIEDRLWEPNGVTLDGAGKFGVISIAEGVYARLRYLTVTGGAAEAGGGLRSAGVARVENMLFLGNAAASGGAIAVSAGRLWLINSTLVDNQAQASGGGLAVVSGVAVVTQCTVVRNRAPTGAGIHSAGALKLANTIVASNLEGEDCYSDGALLAGSAHNLVQRGDGCGKAFISGDPRLGELGMYNGPTRSMPLLGGSPAVNWGDNALAVDADGQPLEWDQRGNGDPRFAAGITDIGAFEQQPNVLLEVDVPGDADVRGCSTQVGDCSLRGAIAIANASPRFNAITFNAKVFANEPRIELRAPLPMITEVLSLSAGTGQSMRVVGNRGWFSGAAGVGITLDRVEVPAAAP